MVISGGCFGNEIVIVTFYRSAWSPDPILPSSNAQPFCKRKKTIRPYNTGPTFWEVSRTTNHDAAQIYSEQLRQRKISPELLEFVRVHKTRPTPVRLEKPLKDGRRGLIPSRLIPSRPLLFLSTHISISSLHSLRQSFIQGTNYSSHHPNQNSWISSPIGTCFWYSHPFFFYSFIWSKSRLKKEKKKGIVVHEYRQVATCVADEMEVFVWDGSLWVYS